MHDIAELLPIKLTPGFISVAFHLGCIGCNFCSVRYGNPRDRLFSAGVHRRYPTRPREIIGLLQRMPSFQKARLPIRLGNDTDLRFEFEDAVDFLDLLPDDYPACVLTRFPIHRDEAARLSRRNLIVKITATPASAHLNSPDNAAAVVESVSYFATPVVLTIGPVTADNWSDCLRLVDAVPVKPNVSVYIKPLNAEFHPLLATIPPIGAVEYAELRRRVSARGLRHLSQLMCPVNDALHLAHKRVSDVPDDERIDCEPCASRDQCYAPEDLSALYSVLASLALTPTGGPVRKGFKSYSIDVAEPTAFGDEAYLSAMLACKMKLSETWRGTGGGAYAASREVLERWQRIGFFPYNILLQEVQRFVEEAFDAADGGPYPN